VTLEETSSGRWTDAQRQHEHAMWAALEQMAPDDPRRGVLRDELITMHLPLVHHLARRYRDRGEDMDDLVQVGTVGLIKAIDGFDPSRGLELSTYATPTILGEIKRHFRDRTWALHVPRRLQVLQAHSRSVRPTSSMRWMRGPRMRPTPSTAPPTTTRSPRH
jgi:RNA polymerase sigma-B factor